MTKHAVLNNIDHQDLKVITRRSADFGDDVNCVLTFPTEYGDMQREYPIFFHKNEQTGEYQSIALLGFNKGENLFLDEHGWNASYVPAMIERGPFLIGVKNREDEEESQTDPMIHIDLDDPRVGETDGEPLFLPHGGNTRYLERIAATLKGIHDGITMSKAMFAAFESLDLIEPVSIDIEIHRDQQYNLGGYHTINEEKLAQLDGAALEKLNRAGFLEGAFLVIASMNNVKKLIELKRKRILQEADKQSIAT